MPPGGSAPTVMRLNQTMQQPIELSGKWVYCLWNFAANDGHPHPDDVNLIPEAWKSGCVAQCVGTEGEYLVLDSGAGTIRVAPFSAVPLPHAPKYLPGQHVRVRGDGDRSPFEAPVRTVGWHFKNKTYIYILEGKSTRYSEAELDSEQ